MKCPAPVTSWTVPRGKNALKPAIATCGQMAWSCIPSIIIAGTPPWPSLNNPGSAATRVSRIRSRCKPSSGNAIAARHSSNVGNAAAYARSQVFVTTSRRSMPSVIMIAPTRYLRLPRTASSWPASSMALIAENHGVSRSSRTFRSVPKMVFMATNRFIRSGYRELTTAPIGPPQSCITSVMSRRSNSSIRLARLRAWRSRV